MSCGDELVGESEGRSRVGARTVHLIAASVALSIGLASAGEPGAPRVLSEGGAEPVAEPVSLSFCTSPEEPDRELCEAFRTLAEAHVFKIGRSGRAGVPSPEMMAFNRLLRDSRAAEAFRALSASESTVVRLYALSGLYFTDETAFSILVEEMESEPVMVPTQRACSVGQDDSSVLIRNESPETLRLSHPGQTLGEWAEAHPELWEEVGYTDIVGGGIPAILRDDLFKMFLASSPEDSDEDAQDP